MELSKSALAAGNGGGPVPPPAAGVEAILAPASTVRIEDVENEE